MAHLEPPPDTSDREKIQEWGSAVALFLETCGRPKDAEKVRAMVELAGAEDADPEKLEVAVQAATLAMTIGVAVAAAEQYRQLIEPTEQALKEIEPGTEMHQQLSSALEIYRVITEHHDQVVKLIQEDHPNVRQEVDKLTAKAEKRLRELGADLPQPSE